MKVLITGGTGMVGRCIRDFTQDDYKTHEYVFIGSKDCDLTDRNAVLEYFKGKKFDFIIHLAADVGGLYKNLDNNIKMFSNNIKINENILEACHLNGIRRGIFCLSSCIYPENPSKFPMDEEMVNESPPHPSNQGYAYAKRMMGIQCRRYNETYGYDYICLIPVNLYGPYDNFNLRESHFIPGIMHRWYLQKKENDKICELHNSDKEKYVLYGTGKPLRQFVYAKDFVRLIFMVLFGDIYTENKPLICCNEETTIKDMALEVAKVMGITEDEIEHDLKKSDGCMRKTVTNMKLQYYYPDFKFTSHEQGLKETYDWFCENYESIRK